MPELPEVETTVRELRKKVLKRTFIDVWTDAKTIKMDLNVFKKAINGQKIENIRRRGKNILFDLSNGCIMLVHLKMTGHLLFGKWEFIKGQWTSLIPGVLREDPMNKFIHLMFFLDKGMLAFSDLRKFGKVELWKNKDILKDLGPEAMEIDYPGFKSLISKRGKIKQVLMDQKIIAGIGNIYSDEILWQARINPFKTAGDLSDKEIKAIYRAMHLILNKAIKASGTSISDFRRPSGEKGDYARLRKAYYKKECSRCQSLIIRKKIGGRSTHYCPQCQQL